MYCTINTSSVYVQYCVETKPRIIHIVTRVGRSPHLVSGKSKDLFSCRPFLSCQYYILVASTSCQLSCLNLLPHGK